MNLLPIIYTSLMIFTGFAVFVVTISYITYKIKEKNRVQYQPAPINLTANYKEQQQKYTNPVQNGSDYSYEYAVRAIQTEQHQEAKKEYLEPPKSQTRYYDSPQTRRSVIEKPKVSKHQYTPSVDFGVRHRTTNVNERNNRFDIVNNQVALSGGGAVVERSNFNLLNYYADDNDVQFPETFSRVS